MGLFDNLKDKVRQFLSDKGLAGWFGRPVMDLTDVMGVISAKPDMAPEGLGAFIDELSDTLNAVGEVANNREFSIGVVGAYSVGKSSFINALLGRQVLPVSARACTALITRIRYGKTEQAVVTTEEGENTLTLDEFMKFSSYNLDDLEELERTGTVARFHKVRKVELFLKSPFLKENRISLLDTAGLGASELDNRKTQEAMKEAVAVIYLSSIRGLSLGDKEVLKRFAKKSADNIFLAVNKSDLIADKKEREDLEALTHLVMGSLGTEEDGKVGAVEEPHAFLVSSRYEQMALGIAEEDDDEDEVVARKMDKDTLAERSGFIALKEGVGRYVGRHTRKARVDYLATQFEEIKQRMAMRENMDALAIQSAVNECGSEIKAIDAELDLLTRRIALIEVQYSTIVEEFPARYMAHVETAKRLFREDRDRMASEESAGAHVDIGFDNALYLRLWGNDGCLFRSKAKKAEKAMELLNPVSAVIVEYIRNTFMTELARLGVEMESLVAERLRQYRLMDDGQIGEQLLKVWTRPGSYLRTLSQDPAVTDGLDSVCRTVSLCLRDEIKRKRTIFSVVNARLHRIFRSEKNNTKRIGRLVAAGTARGEEELADRVEAIKEGLWRNFRDGVNLLKDYTLAPHLKSKGEFTERKEGLLGEIARQKTLRQNESDYFARIASKLDEKVGELYGRR